jgi:hypothetical protein
MPSALRFSAMKYARIHDFLGDLPLVLRLGRFFSFDLQEAARD